MKNENGVIAIYSRKSKYTGRARVSAIACACACAAVFLTELLMRFL